MAIKTPKKRVKKKIDLLGMTPVEARIAIAKDAIAQIRRNKYIIRNSIYCKVNPKLVDDRDQLFDRDDVGKELQSVLRTRFENCEVCAKGGLFISAIRKFDDFRIQNSILDTWQDKNYSDDRGPLNDGGLVTSHLRKFFGKEQLELIEYAFEQGYNGNPRNTKLAYKAMIFGKGFTLDEERMLAILKNIIANRGEFVPPELTEEQKRKYEEGDR
jgi:hypothetical protein